jgi:hypothetical protein
MNLKVGLITITALELKDSFAKGKTILEMTSLARSGWVRFLWSLTVVGWTTFLIPYPDTVRWGTHVW